MILMKQYHRGNKYIFGKVSPSNLRWFGVEDELIDRFEEIDAKLQVLCANKSGEEGEIAKLFNERKRAQETIERQLEELSKEEEH